MQIGDENVETKYRILNGKITERGILRRDIAQSIGVSSRAFRNKMTGTAPFTWDEVKLIRQKYFPDCALEYLFNTSIEKE